MATFSPSRWVRSVAGAFDEGDTADRFLVPRDQAGQRSLYRALAILGLVTIPIEFVEGSATGLAGTAFATIFMLANLGALVLLERKPVAAAYLAGAGMTLAGVGVGILYLSPLAIVSPFIGFTLVATEIRGRTLASFAVFATVVAGIGGALQFAIHRGDGGVFGAIVQAAAMSGLLIFVVWHHRRQAETSLVRYATLVDDMPIGIARATPDGLVTDTNAAFLRLVGADDGSLIVNHPVRALLARPDGFEAIVDSLRPDGTVVGETELRRLDGTTLWVRYRARRLVGRDGTTTGLEATVEDITSERAASEAAAHLAAVVGSARDAITTTSLDGRIHTWNRGAERLYGWPAAEMIGESIDKVLPSGQFAALQPIYRRIAAGKSARPFETTRIHRTGAAIPVLVTLSPVHDADGAVTGISGIVRDLSSQRELEGRIKRGTRQRTDILRTLAAITPGTAGNGVAEAICKAIATTSSFDHVALIALSDDESRMLALWTADELTPNLSHDIEDARAVELRVLALSGPWVAALTDTSGSDHNAKLRARGIRILAYAPIWQDGGLVGLLIGGARGYDRNMVLERLPILVEFAAVAGVLVRADLITHQAAVAAIARIRSIIATAAFHPVFQPVVDLRSGAILGYEALTRFDDGTPPDQVFAAAMEVGLGLDLEVATLEAAMHASGPLPANVFLDLNVSPDLLLAREPLRTLLRQWGWGVVLEVTEHVPIADYAAVRQAVSEIGTNVRLAVDDAGAGFSSLRHVLELRPAFIKLDRTLIAGIDADPARQALVAGMHHIATSLGSVLIAEGVETEDERAMLIELGAGAAQGYLFGRPRSLDEQSPKPRIVRGPLSA